MPRILKLVNVLLGFANFYTHAFALSCSGSIELTGNTIKKFTLTAALIVALAAVPASAATTIFTERASFETAVGGVTTETFNSIASEISFQSTPLALNAFTLSGFGDQFDRNFIDIPPHQFGVFDIDGTTNINAVTANHTGLTFEFSSAIFAFGADFGAFQNDEVQSQIVVAGETLTSPIQDGNAVQFFGFTSDTALTSIIF